MKYVSKEVVGDGSVENRPVEEASAQWLLKKLKMLLPKNQLKKCLIQWLEKISLRNNIDDVTITNSIKDVAVETERVYYINKLCWAKPRSTYFSWAGTGFGYENWFNLVIAEEISILTYFVFLVQRPWSEPIKSARPWLTAWVSQADFLSSPEL